MICKSCTEPDEPHSTVSMGRNNYSYGQRLRELLAKKVKMSNTYHTARTGSGRFQHIRQWMTDLEARYGAVTSYYMSEMLQLLTTSNHLKIRNKNGHIYYIYNIPFNWLAIVWIFFPTYRTGNKAKSNVRGKKHQTWSQAKGYKLKWLIQKPLI